jgi:mono/diheme cytochrome c family protein
MESNTKIIMKILFAIATALLISCTARRSEPIKGTIAELKNEEVLRGRQLFMQHCHKCHPMGESGLGPAINNNYGPQFLKRFQVRHGLGVMPSFDRNAISKEELRDISSYMKALQRNRECP